MSKKTLRNKKRKCDEVCSREELLAQAETIGMDALGWIHGGAEATSGCCTWGAKTKCNRCRPENCNPPPPPPSGGGAAPKQ